MSSMFLAMQTAMKHHEMKKLLQEQQQDKLIKKRLSEQVKEKKKFDINVLSKGGVTYWQQQYTDNNGKVKTKDVKITVLTQEYQDYINSGGDTDFNLIRKGKFSFRDGCGSRVFISVKSYAEAEKFIEEFYGKGKYTLSCSAI